jgi:hypothetical protein
MKPQAPTRTATSSTTYSLMTVFPPALPCSAPPTTALERQNTPGDPPEHPPDASQPPDMPQTPRNRAVSRPPASCTPAASPTTPSIPRSTPRSPSKPQSTPVHPSSPQPHPKRAVPTLPTRFDWAEDAESLPIPPPTPPAPPRDLSGLRSNLLGPFRSLRRRARRRTPPFILQRREFFYSVPPPQPQPFITRRHPSGIGPGRPVVIVPYGVTPAPPAPPALVLNWDQDPRLADLSRALRALGWTPPC